MGEKILHSDKNWKRIWGVVLLLAWSTVIALFLHAHGRLSLEELLRYTPESKPLALLVMLGLFLLKSVDFLMHSGVLYAANGVMFPLPLAILLNLGGAALIITVPYCIGRTLGPPVVSHILEKYPKMRAIEKLRSGSETVLTMVIRLMGLPLNVVSIYLGAVEFGYGGYMLGSLLGLLPAIVCFTVMGVSASDTGSPAFWIALTVQVITSLLSIVIYAIVMKRQKKIEN